jgi:hypothetical protein
MVAKVRERPAGNKGRSQRFHMERFNLKKLNEVGCPKLLNKSHYSIQVK